MNKTRAFWLACLVTCAIILAAAFLPQPYRPKASVELYTGDRPSAWNFTPPPENTPILGLWERPDEPGYYDAFAVVHVGNQWIADVPGDAPAVSIQAKPPVCWTRLP